MKNFAVFLLVGCLVGSYADKPKRIVFGQRAVAGEFPYQVFLRIYSYFSCGGALITDRHVLTTARCTQSSQPPHENLVVITGTVDASMGSNGEVHNIKAIYMHPQFVIDLDASQLHNIAVITLKQPITRNRFQKPINIATTSIPVGLLPHFTYWGWPNLDRPIPKFLMKLNTVILSKHACRETIADTIYPPQFCTYPGVGAGACNGDHGGPLVYNNTLIGIASWADTCAMTEADIFTSVSYYKDFIYQGMRHNDMVDRSFTNK